MSGLAGLYPAIVTDLVDPDRLGRIEVSLPGLGQAGDHARFWATLLTPYADDKQGIQVLPAVGTEVVVGFEAGAGHRAYLVGSCWNGRESMPVDASAANNKRVWRSREGSLLEFDDTKDAVKLTLSTDSGHTVVLDASGGGQVQVQHSAGFGITLDAGGAVQITANAGVTINAPGGMKVITPTTTFTGSVICQTMLSTPSVVSASYTSGAGNVW